MVPKKLNLITLVSMFIAGFYMFMMFIFSIDADDDLSMYIQLASVLGFMLVFLAAFVMKKGSKVGLYIFIAGYAINLVNVTQLAIMLSYLWLVYCLFIILRDSEIKEFLHLNTSTAAQPRMPQQTTSVQQNQQKAKAIMMSRLSKH